MMTNKFNEVVDELNKTSRTAGSFEDDIATRLTSEEADMSGDMPAPTNTLIRLSCTVPHHPYDELVVEDSNLFEKYAIVGGSVHLEDKTIHILSGIEFSIQEDGLHITCPDWETYGDHKCTVILMTIPSGEEDDEDE